MPNALLGDDYRLYWDTAVDFDMPTWVWQRNFGDLALDDSAAEVEIPVRYPWVFYKPGRRDTNLTFTMNYHPTETFHLFVRDQIRNGGRVHLAIVEGNISTADYFHAWFMLTGPADFSLDAPATYSVSARLSIDFGATEEPTYVNVV